MSTKRFKYLGYLQIFIGMGAVAGGLPMIIAPSGSDTGLSTEILQNTPFENYLIPGIILFTTNGMGNLIASYFSLKIRYVAGILGIVFGAALVIWIVVQLYYLGYSNWFQPLYLALGTIELLLGASIYKKFK